MKEQYVVYAHHTVLTETIVRAYSPAEAQYIMEQRQKKNGLFEAGVDKVMSEAEEAAIMDGRDNPAMW